MRGGRSSRRWKVAARCCWRTASASAAGTARRNPGDFPAGQARSRSSRTPGDGNTHPTIVFDATDEAAKERAALTFTEMMELAFSLGTITGEHGVGRLEKARCFPASSAPRVTELTKEVKQFLTRTTSSTRARSSGPGRPAGTFGRQ